MSKKKRVILICTAITLILITAWIVWSNKALQTNTYIIESERISYSFDSYRIAQISDLHNAQIGKDNKRLIKALSDAHPDIIVVTGDLIDARHPNIGVATSFMKQALEIAPCYYINGNHEARIPEEYETLKSELTKLDVTILENDSIKLNKSDEYITLSGIKDPTFYNDLVRSRLTKTTIKNAKQDDDSFAILLSHRPELFEQYVKHGFDLVFTGHAHGGQFRLPVAGGLFAPNQGFLPQYDSGLFTEQNTNMLVNRGIGNSLFPFRVNNRPEIIVAELKAK